MTLLTTTLNPVAEWRSRQPVPHLVVRRFLALHMKRKQDHNSWMDELTWAELPGLFDASLDFLRTEHGFHAADEHIGELTFGRYYLRQHVGVEVSLDRRDRCLDSYFLRLSGGRVPEGWAVDTAGQRFRVAITEALRSRRIPLHGVPIPPGTPAPAALELQLQWVAVHVRDHFPDILADSDCLFSDFNHPK